jgi:uncharacterized protein YecE (DUF72 family)
MSSVELRDLADQTPKGFRFMVKAHEAITLRRVPEHPRYGCNVGQANPLYFDSEYAQRAVVAPVVSGFGDRLGFLLFQFAPQRLGNAFSFTERLSRFLSRLPSGLPLAVELRTPGAFTSEYIACLEENRASHSLLVHPTMPPIEEQWERTKHLPGPVLVRWMLRRDRSYQVARAEFAPFDRIALDDERSREEIARIIEACAGEHRPITVIANNKAEGSSPLSLARLAEALRTA